jgi:NAD(P)-dependent dehydrogenase (short-subunit alcohol dehydrogenase family)
VTAALTAESPRALAGQVALVTGASRGLGQVIAGALAGAGATVGLVARSAGPLAQAQDRLTRAGGTAVAVTADVTDPDDLAAAVERVSHRLGPIDVLVNNAGVGGPNGALWEVDPAAWWQAMEVNLRSVLSCTRLVLPAMIARRHGRIVNITSNAGAYRWPLASAYAVSKAAGIKLTENLAVELRGRGVAVFSADPGLLPIGMSEPALANRPPANPAEAKIASWIRRELEQGRGAEPGAAGSFVLRLAAGDCDCLSGCHLTVHDDLDALIEQADEISRHDLYTLRREEPPSTRAVRASTDTGGSGIANYPYSSPILRKPSRP